MPLQGKKILILSPQSWGTMFLSKHHYAIELSRAGNLVYFLNPPMNDSAIRGIKIKSIQEYPNLHIIDQEFPWWIKLKFHLPVLFKWIMRFRVNNIVKKIGQPDIVWSFDLGSYYPLSYFKKPFKIFHPVDEPLNQAALDSGKGADVIFSVTEEILEKYSMYACPKFFINHGISNDFLNAFIPFYSVNSPIRVGLSGNFTRPDIDWKNVTNIIKSHTELHFNFYGSYKSNQSNIAGNSEHSDSYIQELIHLENVIFHGPIPSHKLAQELQGIDVFLICYDIKKDQSKGTNYHKVMEYLSTGQVVVSNHITTYSKRNDLLALSQDRDQNSDLPALFNQVVNNLDYFNSQENRSLRHHFAKSNTYFEQIKRIEAIVDDLIVPAVFKNELHFNAQQ